jgi:hypothetical protein
MPHRLPPGCIEDRDRHGNFRVYYRRKGYPKVRIHGTPWTPEFMAQYDAAKKIAAPIKQGVLTRVGFAYGISMRAPITSVSIRALDMSAGKFSKRHLMN